MSIVTHSQCLKTVPRAATTSPGQLTLRQTLHQVGKPIACLLALVVVAPLLPAIGLLYLVAYLDQSE